jgi:hypothetical protein
MLPKRPRQFTRVFLAMLYALPALSLLAQETPKPIAPQIDVAAVIRRGDHVEHIDGMRSNTEIAFDAITGPPENDNNKFHITIVTGENCPPCKKLLSDLATDKNLQAFMNINDKKSSWSHLNIFKYDDPNHKWFFKDIQIKGFPTILIQPPRSRVYGDPAKVIFQKTGYDDPAKLAKQISEGLKEYALKFSTEQSQTANRGYKQTTTPTRPEPAPECQDFPTGYKQTAPYVTPITPTPGPSQPLIIPDIVDPDKQQPTPAPLPSVMVPRPSTKETINVVIGPSTLFSDDGSSRVFDRLLRRLRSVYPDAVIRPITPEQAATEFPNVDTSQPTAILTRDGKLLQAIPQRMIDELLKDSPELATLSQIIALVSTVFPAAKFASWVLLAVLVWREYRRRKDANATPSPTPPQATPTAPAVG